MKIQYIANDGHVFNDETKCKEYENYCALPYKDFLFTGTWGVMITAKTKEEAIDEFIHNTYPEDFQIDEDYVIEEWESSGKNPKNC